MYIDELLHLALFQKMKEVSTEFMEQIAPDFIVTDLKKMINVIQHFLSMTFRLFCVRGHEGHFH
jgi:hypothetical protein